MLAGFVTEKLIIQQPVVISVQQQDKETVELIASFAQGDGSYCLGIFTDGKFNLCTVGIDVLRKLGLRSDHLGRIIVGSQ